MEQILEFVNREGQRLVGIVHIPEARTRKENIGVLMLQAGLKDRVGAHRLYVKIARMLCNQGFFVFRFDSHGVGDSGGEMHRGLSVDNFKLIEQGCFSGDANDAVQSFIDRKQLDRVVMIGLCGGGITAIISASVDKRIENVILLDPSVTMDDLDKLTKLHPLHVQNRFAEYKNKIFKLENWLRLLTLKTNIRELWSIIKAYVVVKLNARKNIDGNGLLINSQLNKHFIDAFNLYITSGRRILFLMAESDAAWDFKDKFLTMYIHNPFCASLCSIEYIETANHEFASLKAQNTLLKRISNWMMDIYGTI